MILGGARLIVLPDRHLLPVGIPLVLAGLFPTEQAGLVNPLIRAPAQHQRILFPDAATGEIEACVPEGLTEVQPFSICVPDIDAAVIGKVGVHAAVGREEEVVEILVGHPRQYRQSNRPED